MITTLAAWKGSVSEGTVGAAGNVVEGVAGAEGTIEEVLEGAVGYGGPAEVMLEGIARCDGSAGEGWPSTEISSRRKRGSAMQLAARLKRNRFQERKYIVGLTMRIVNGLGPYVMGTQQR